MVFSSFVFLSCFLPIVVLCYFCLPSIKMKNIFLLISSLLFYAYGDPKYTIMMLIIIIYTHLGALYIYECSKIIYKKIVLFFVLSIIFTCLFYFKYFNFGIHIINDIFHQNINSVKVILPIGISFYTFQSASYLIDVYKGDKPQKNIYNSALYISMFPQLVAGPIVKYQTIQKQLSNRKHSLDNIYEGISRFIMGLSKKIIIADTLSMSVDKIFETPVNELTQAICWVGISFYTLQIYFDFSGYSDMAIGLGRVFGFNFLENFNYPYISKSITEFWRRWHISLSSWFKNYIYIPLGGNRRGLIITIRNLIIVFFLTGLWHGAEYVFIIWGLWHVSFIILEKLINNLKHIFSFNVHNVLLKNILNGVLFLYALFVIIIGWVFFRAENLEYAVLYINALFNNINFEPDFYLGYYVSFGIWGIFAIGILLALGVGKKILDFMDSTPRMYYIKDLILLISLFLCIIFLTTKSYNPFIYFRF